jgi:chromosome segregation and condensation protein ScpB
MTDNELTAVMERIVTSDLREKESIEWIIHVLRSQGWIVISPSEQDEGRKQKWETG